MKRAEKILFIALFLAVLNTGYLSYRFIALRSGFAEPGTGICSITEYVDCDKVLLSDEARAFYVPNALLGFGFFTGCLLWLLGGRRLDEHYRKHILMTLTFWLGIAILLTFWFFKLLIFLPYFCPFCPWNHLLTYIAFGAALKNFYTTPKSVEKLSPKTLVILILSSIVLFFIVLGIWYFAFVKGFIK